MTVPNPENDRLKALIASYETRIEELEKEENEWTKTVETMDTSEGSSSSTKHAKDNDEQVREVLCELQIAPEVRSLQQAAISQVETSAERVCCIFFLFCLIKILMLHFRNR